MSGKIADLKEIAIRLKRMLEAAYPRQERRRGRPRANWSRTVKGILYVLVEGIRWRALPRRFGAKSTVHKYFLELAGSGAFQEMLISLVKEGIKKSLFKCDVMIEDGADRPVKNMQEEDADFGYKYRGKRSVKITLITEKQGIPIGVDVGSGGVHDVKRLEPAIENLLVKEAENEPSELLADRGYCGQNPKAVARKHGLTLVTSEKSNSKRKNTRTEKNLIKENRWKVEGALKRLFTFRRVDYCTDQTIISYAGWCHLALACILVSHF